MPDEIGDFLDIPDIEVTPREMVVAPIEKGVSQNAQDDYEEVRHNLKQIIADGSSAVNTLSRVAQQSESPRAYEVLGAYLKTLADVNEQLIDLHTRRLKVDIEQAKATGESAQPSDVHNTNVFVGSTEELQKYLESR